ncbi:hypothetical protein ACJMK2_035407 [Sinanodonta woodiana]|uniref:Palmitoyltransferase n=1 Tax=Sinanodonta woodiana TaxID=1069815 RepID=A0ABD3WUU8_SINWO
MDFLMLTAIYVLLFGVSVAFYLYKDHRILCTGPVGFLREIIAQAFYRVVPSVIIDWSKTVGYYVLFKRNPLFQLLFLVLVILGHGVFIYDMLPVLEMFETEKNHTFFPLLVLFTNGLMFHWSCITDPGEITQKNLQRYSSVYEYDGNLYQQNMICTTCKFQKPARSKHCSVCNRCVHRFDHHCVWTNNCVGGLNHRFFLLYLMTLTLMFAQGVYVGSHCLNLYIQRFNLWNASYVDHDGIVQPVTILIVFQHLFLQVPRLVFLVVSLVLLTFLVGGFMVYQFYLVCINLTTNETYKIKELKKRHSHVHSNGTDDNARTSSKKQLKSSAKNVLKPYQQSAIENLLEVFVPYSFIKWKNKEN